MPDQNQPPRKRAESAADLLPYRPGPHSRRPVKGAIGKRRPAYEESKDSGLYVDEIVLAGHRRKTLIETAGPAVVVILELDAAPRVEFTEMTERETRAWKAFRDRDIRTDIILDAYHDCESLSGSDS